MPISRTCKKQRAVSHSTEDEIMSLDAGLRMEGRPAMTLWGTIIDILHPQAGGDSKLVHQTQILKNHDPSGDIDVSPNARSFSMRTSLYIFEDNEAVVKQINKVTIVMYHAHIVLIWIVFVTASI